jgi:hypothetical protein
MSTTATETRTGTTTASVRGVQIRTPRPRRARMAIQADREQRDRAWLRPERSSRYS